MYRWLSFTYIYMVYVSVRETCQEAMEKQLERIDGIESRVRERLSQTIHQGKHDAGRQLDQQA